MQAILKKILEHKREEVKSRKEKIALSSLKESVDNTVGHSLKERLLSRNTTGFISEFKRKSPSKPTINLDAEVKTIIPDYVSADVAGISVLTDNYFFGGSDEDLSETRSLSPIPILRKDFIIDPYQIFESKHLGADVILLIASILESDIISELYTLAQSIDLEVLAEVHSAEEIEKVGSNFDILGVNNRNLDTFVTDYRNSIELRKALPSDACIISESGIHSIEEMLELHNAGYYGFLIGERFMKTNDPGKACLELSKQYLSKRDRLYDH